MGKYRAPLANSDVIHLGRNKTPEQNLWIAVLAKAFEDAFRSSDERAALSALSWIRHGSDFNYVCGLAGRDPNYVRRKVLTKAINREATILGRHMRIKEATNNVIQLKPLKLRKIKKEQLPSKPKKVYKYKEYKNFEWLPKYDHGYVDR
jgi:hypothetical protein